MFLYLFFWLSAVLGFRMLRFWTLLSFKILMMSAAYSGTNEVQGGASYYS